MKRHGAGIGTTETWTGASNRARLLRGREAPPRSAFARVAIACVLSLALVVGLGAIAGCSNSERDRSDDTEASVPTTSPGLVDEDRSWVAEAPETYVGEYSGQFERFFEGRGHVAIPIAVSVTTQQVEGSWDGTASVPGGRPLRWHTSGEFSAEVLEDGTFLGEGTAVTYTTGASREGTETPQPIQVAGRLSDDAIILGDLIFERGPLTFQAVREAE